MEVVKEIYKDGYIEKTFKSGKYIIRGILEGELSAQAMDEYHNRILDLAKKRGLL